MECVCDDDDDDDDDDNDLLFILDFYINYS